jgi:hypothetical protein
MTGPDEQVFDQASGQVYGDRALNDIGVLKRREIEARILASVLDRLGREFGDSAFARSRRTRWSKWLELRDPTSPTPPGPTTSRRSRSR